MRLHLRPATPSDATTIATLVRELAADEGLEAEVRSTPEDLARLLFGRDAVGHALLAEVDDEVVGFALYFRNLSTLLGRPGLYLEDLYVRPAWRGRGVGRALLASLAQEAVARGYGRLDWAVQRANTSARAVYRHLGARELDDWLLCRLEGTALAQLAAAAPAAP